MFIKKKIFPSILAFLFVFALALTQVHFVEAQGGQEQPGGEQTQVSETNVFPNPLGNNITYQAVVANIIKATLGIVGVAALIMFIYGGITWMTSLGNSERVKKGRDILVWAAIGIFVVFASFAMVNLILSAFKTT